VTPLVGPAIGEPQASVELSGDMPPVHEYPFDPATQPVTVLSAMHPAVVLPALQQ
jgi:hypothetical protein